MTAGHRNRIFWYRVGLLPGFTSEGDLPPGVHLADWDELRSRFGSSTPRRIWLFGKLEALVAAAAGTEKLLRIFLWGSFVTAKPAPGDLDILVIMANDFETSDVVPPCSAVFESTQARSVFEADVFWARASIGRETLALWLETYQTSRTFRKRGIVELELP